MFNTKREEHKWVYASFFSDAFLCLFNPGFSVLHMRLFVPCPFCYSGQLGHSGIETNGA